MKELRFTRNPARDGPKRLLKSKTDAPKNAREYIQSRSLKIRKQFNAHQARRSNSCTLIEDNADELDSLGRANLKLVASLKLDARYPELATEYFAGGTSD